jgi:hypothetical protein
MNTNPTYLHFALAAAASAALACGSEAADAVGSTPVPTERLPDRTFTFTPDPGAAPATERARRRLDLDQLDRSFRVVTGGLGWTRGSGEREVNRLDELAATLGKPDFIETVDEDLSPSPMFSKFLDDAARSVCDRWLREDRSRPAETRTFFTAIEPDASPAEAPEAARENVRRLLLRAHGRWSEDPADPALARWTRLLDVANERGLDAGAGWRAVCVGLFTHPDFYLY